ncbi:MAG TPA: TetR family transcriptional regulator [Acidimicrobiia bacterium]|nr:TetR family transcriptional regulator [Acidimicrobiia bacterium]
MDRTRAAIVEAALELFSEQGFTETTVDAIAERADVGRRTFFRYFPAKESVLFHDIEAQIQATLAALAARPPDEPPFQGLIWVLRDSAGRFSADVEKRALLAKVAHECDNLLVHHRAVVMRRLEDLITAEIARRSGVPVEDLATGAAVAAILAAYGSAVRRWILDGATEPLQPLVETALDAAQEALAAGR